MRWVCTARFFFHSNSDSSTWMVPFQMRVLGMCISGKKYYSIVSDSIQIIFENRSIKNPPRTHAPQIHAHTMTQGAAFMICVKSICLFQQLRHQHSTSILFQRGLRQIDLHAPKTDHYLFIYLFIYLTKHSLHDGELETSKI